MDAAVGTARYDRPNHILRTRREWLVVARWGVQGEFLTLSSTRSPPPLGRAAAPIGLSPRCTCLGILAAEDPADGASSFILVRRLPAGVVVAGTFAPADGFVRVLGDGPTLSLSGAARHARCIGWSGPASACTDGPDPVLQSHSPAAWHIDAQRRPWVGEFVPRGLDDPAAHRVTLGRRSDRAARMAQWVGG
jgi:hypothetical protein